MSSLGSEIVIGIDFGTTHSGVSWAARGTKREPRLIKDWPSPYNAVTATNAKVPTQIYYPKGKPLQWGYAIEKKNPSLQWFKLLLDPDRKDDENVKQIMELNRQLKQVNKTAVQVTTDYLRLLWEYTKKDIREVKGDNYGEIYALRVILTVPAIWSEAAKRNTLQAAHDAGISDNIELVAEPEAAALATLRDENNDGALKEGDTFVVCDAGGGTVVWYSTSHISMSIAYNSQSKDLISYEVKKTDPLIVKECAVGSGGLCGSVILDLRFESWIATIVGHDELYNRENDPKGIKIPSRRKMMEEFEYSIKRTFTGDPHQKYSVELRGVKDSESDGIKIVDDTIKIPVPTLKTIFDYVVNQIQELVEEQIAEVSEKGLAVKAIFLVGGFSGNGYLFERLKSSQKTSKIAVRKDPEPWSAVCRGATLWGLEHQQKVSIPKHVTVASKICRHSYGVAVYEDYDESKGHQLEDRHFSHALGKYRAKNQMRWIIKKGDEFRPGDFSDIPLGCISSLRSWQRGEAKVADQLSLYRCKVSNPPTRRKDEDPVVTPFCKVSCTVPWVLVRDHSESFTKAGEEWRKIRLRLHVELGATTLKFRVYHKDEPMADIEAHYAATS